MQIVIAIISVFGGAAIIMFLSTLKITGGVKVAIIIPIVFLIVYSMARIQSKEPKSEKDAGK
jgi:hypothetical protein